MRTKTPAERANINARARVRPLKQLPTIKRALREELGELPIEMGTVEWALDAAFEAGRRAEQRELAI